MCLLGPLVFVPCRDSSLSAGGVVHRTAPTHFRPINSQRLHVDGRMLADGVISEGSQQYRNCSVWLFVPLCPACRTFGWHKQKFNLPCVRRMYSPVPDKQETFPQTISDTNGFSKTTVGVQICWTLKWKLAFTVDLKVSSASWNIKWHQKWRESLWEDGIWGDLDTDGKPKTLLTLKEQT